MAGRPSFKRQKLFDLYALLRCAMFQDDVEELLKRNPRFHDLCLDDTDMSIQEAIFDMTAAMVAVSPPDLGKAIPIGG